MLTTHSQPLVLAAQQGDAAALDALLAQHLPGLRAFVRLRCGAALRARESASDIAQSACRDVLQNLERFQWNGEASFRAWLYTTAARKIADRAEYWGAQKRDARRNVPLDPTLPGESQTGVAAPLLEIYSDVCSPSQAAVGKETLEQIELAFDALDDEQREVIVLARIVGLPHREIAARLSCTEAHARRKLFRALSALSEALEGGATA